MQVPRWIVLDDTDPAIQYISDAWFLDISGSQNNLGNLGPAYESTLHGTNQNASFTFNFSGSQFIVYGTNSPDTTNDGVFNPSCECFIDGIETGTNGPSTYIANNWEYCSGQVEDGPHILSVNVTASSRAFWFDQIRYVPSASVPLDGKAILIDNMDPQLQNSYSPGWIALGVANETAETNTSFSFEFIGESVTWFGRSLPTNLSQPVAGSASYTIDNGISGNFLLEGLAANSPELFNVKLFQTPNLTQGVHGIKVLFEGDPTTTPLTFDYLIVQNGSTTTSSSSLPSIISGSVPANTTVPIPKDVQQGSHKNNVVIVGSSIGALALILLTVIIAHYVRHRHSRKRIIISTQLPPPNVDASSNSVLRQRPSHQLRKAFPIPQLIQNSSYSLLSDTRAPSTNRQQVISNEAESSLTTPGNDGRYNEVEQPGIQSSSLPSNIYTPNISLLHEGSSNSSQRVIEIPPEYTPY